MISIPGLPGSTCDGFSRREFLRIGGMGMAGISLADILRLQARANEAPASKGKAGWGKAKSVIFVFLQGGPSHIDIWDPKPDAPSNVRGEFKPIKSKVPGIWLSETMPKLAQQIDKATLIRSVSYTPAGLFNHTAAHYQMMTGYTPDRVSPSGQLEPPAPNDYPHAGAQIARIKPPDVPMLPFVLLPRPTQESNVIGKGSTAGFLGAAFDPYYFYQDPNKEIKLDDLTLRKDVSKERLARRENLLHQVNAAMPDMEKAVEKYAIDKYYQKAFDLVSSGRARDAFDLTKEKDSLRDKYGRYTFGQGLLLAPDQAKENERQPEIAALHHAPSPMRWKGRQVTQEDEERPVSNLAFGNGYFGPMGARGAPLRDRRCPGSRPRWLPDRDLL